MVTITTTYNELNKLQYNNSILTIGSFDGLHLGHKKILKSMNNIASNKINSNNKILITFDPHPYSILNTKINNKYYLSESMDEKIYVLNKYFKSMIDVIIIIKFDLELSKISATNFFDKIIKTFLPTDVVMGYDNGFGYKREGNAKFLKDNYQNSNFDLHIIKPEQNDSRTIISSTLIRKSINNGNINNANLMLGRNYSISGKVIKGQGLGKTIGYPTINISLYNKSQIVPQRGVYFVNIIIEKNIYKGMCNIGFRPTVTNNKEETIESHIFTVERNNDFYGKSVKILFIEYIREEKKFKNIKFLAKQLEEDKKYCLSIRD